MRIDCPHPSPPFGVNLRWTVLRAKENGTQYKKIRCPVFKSVSGCYCICAACHIYRLNCPGFESRCRYKRFSSAKASTPDLGPTRPPIQWIPEIISWDKAAGCEGNHSSLPSAKDKNAWSYHPIPPTRLQGMDRENFNVCPIFKKKSVHNVYSDYIFGMRLRTKKLLFP